MTGRMAVPGALLLGSILGLGGAWGLARSAAPGPVQPEMVPGAGAPAHPQAVPEVIPAAPAAPAAPAPPKQPGPDRTPAAPLPDWRVQTAAAHRARYTEVLAELRDELALGADAWLAIQPVLARHFEPVEAAMGDLCAGRSSAPPSVNGLVSPRLAETLEGLRAALAPEAWAAFEAWRHAEEPAPAWGPSRGDYFLADREHADGQARRARQLHWAVLSAGLERLNGLIQAETERPKVENAFRNHLARLLAGETGPAPQDDLRRSRARSLAPALESEIRRTLSPNSQHNYGVWKQESGNRAVLYLGEAVPQPLWTPPIRRPAPPPPPAGPVPPADKGLKF